MVREKTYTPLPNSGPAILAGLVLLAGYVVGPAIGTVLGRIYAAVRLVDDELAEFPTTEGEAR